MKKLRKILIIDDMQINRIVLKKMLENEYEILEATNGQEALEVLKNEGDEISAILLDLLMPVMDGYTFLEKVKKIKDYASIPIIVTTGEEGLDEEVRAFNAGASDFIVKPYQVQIIRKRVENVIRLRETTAMVYAFKFDQLTGLYSKEYFLQKAKEYINENPNKNFDVVCTDIENFKLVKDIFGIKKSDALLCFYANVTRDSEFNNLDMCGRITSDVLVMLRETTPYTKDMAEKYIKRINQFEISRKVDIKFGVCHVDDTSISVNNMCDRALLAIDTVKGKYNSYFGFYNDTLRQNLLVEQTIVDNMEDAIEKKQFVVYLQPKYDTTSKKIIGAEALVRWNHPKYNFLTPKDFIPLFEKNGFVTKLDKYVWEETCHIIRTWIDEDRPLIPISVNISRADIYHIDIVKTLTNLIEKYKIDPKYLHLEITESAYTENAEQIIETVTKLRSKGFIIEMDDFGTGYSSLGMFSSLPIDILKLDMSFINNELKEEKEGKNKENNKTVLEFIVNLAHWLNLFVVAEGVETEEQNDKLKEINCKCAQGYYFAKPMPVIEFNKFIKENYKLV